MEFIQKFQNLLATVLLRRENSGSAQDEGKLLYIVMTISQIKSWKFFLYIIKHAGVAVEILVTSLSN